MFLVDTIICRRGNLVSNQPAAKKNDRSHFRKSISLGCTSSAANTLLFDINALRRYDVLPGRLSRTTKRRAVRGSCVVVPEKRKEQQTRTAFPTPASQITIRSPYLRRTRKAFISRKRKQQQQKDRTISTRLEDLNLTGS